MNLFGLSLTILGAPVPGAEVVSYGKPENRVYRELFIVNDQIVGGALVGDISDAGIFHASMISGIFDSHVKKKDPDFVKPHRKAFSQRAWHDLNQYRRACIIP
jgi:NAD(P)H-nitrite reductase large subunit